MPEEEISQIEDHLKHAEAKMMQAEMADAEGKEVLNQEAKDHLIRSEKLMPGSGAWLMCCIHARANNGEMCLKWLDRAKKSKMLPDTGTIMNNPYFANAVTEKWFFTWLKSGQ